MSAAPSPRAAGATPPAGRRGAGALRAGALRTGALRLAVFVFAAALRAGALRVAAFFFATTLRAAVLRRAAALFRGAALPPRPPAARRLPAPPFRVAIAPPGP